MKKILGINQLMLIVIVALFCDHASWRLFGYSTPLAQFFFVMGRMVILIVCYEAVEEFKITSNYRNYIFFVLGAWLVSIYPYNAYMGPMFQKRQNLMYDVLLMLLALDILKAREEERMTKAISWILFSALVLISLVSSSCPILPIVFGIIVYKKDMNVHVAVEVAVIIVLSQGIHLAGVCGLHVLYGITMQKEWYGNLSILGYLLAIPVLLLYNGDGKRKRKMKFSFFLIYPISFIILSSLLNVWEYQYFDFYLMLHGVTLILMIVFGVIALKTKPSKAQLANILLIISALFYMAGYYLELTASSLEVVYVAKKIEYCGLLGIFTEYTRFMDAFFDAKFKKWVYVFETIISGVILVFAFTMDRTSLFYRKVVLYKRNSFTSIEYDLGLISYLFYFYIAIAFIVIVFFCVGRSKKKSKEEKRRYVYIMIGGSLPIISLLLEKTGMRDGRYYMTYGILGFTLFFNLAFIQDDYFSKVQTEAEKDPLTGVGNRRYFTQMMEIGLMNRKRGSLIMLDMDNFKYVNDTFGHGMGDKVLTTLGKSLMQVIPVSHYVARLGGDEFCIYMVNMTRRKELEAILNQLNDVFQANMKFLNIDFKASLSIGIAEYSGKRAITFEQLYENADKALYLAKNSGKGQYRFFR